VENKHAMRHELEALVRHAGRILMSYYNKPLHRTYKNHQGFATEADVAVERYLIEQLHKLMPEASIYAEESGASGNQYADYSWIIDPLDGTTNFAQTLPYFCISVALTYKGEPQIGVVYQPLLDELFYASKGDGASLNGVPIAVSAPHNLKETMLVVGLPYAKNAVFMTLLDDIKRITPYTYAFRHFGAAALDCAYVACGRLDGVFLASLKWWDVAAGMLLIQEAGGVVTDFEGKPIDASYATFVAGGPMVHKHLHNLLQTEGS